ncbi:MAG: S1C family serine protease [Verrucomicrobiota bacterium]|nr:S1C family serine protease [Verrucomicrobiota bacterium]
MRQFFFAVVLCSCASLARAEEQAAAGTISREVKDVFDHCAKAVVKIRAVDEHGKLAGTGFFIDPAGTLYTAFSVAADADDFTVEFEGKELPARAIMTDRRSGIALLKIDAATPVLPIGKSEDLEVTTPVLTVGFPLDLPKTPSFGMIAGFDRKFLGRYFSTTHLRVNLPTQRGEAGAPLLNLKGEVVGILVSSIDNGSACYALPIDAAEKIRSDFVRFGEVRHGWIGINVAEAPNEVDGSNAEFTDIMPGTPAADSGAKPGDILLEVGKKKVHRPEDVIDASFFITAGDKVPITVMRGNEKLTFTVEADFHPGAQRPPVIASPLSPQSMPLGLDRTP